MKVLSTLLLFTHSCFCFCQSNISVEIKDFRSNRDSLTITKSIPSATELSSQYICRIFDFCIPIKDKNWLTSPLPNEQPSLSARSDLSQMVVERDLKGRIISQVYYRCVGCLPESYGYTFSYDIAGNKVTIIELAGEDIILQRQGLKPGEENLKKRLTTLVTYSNKGAILNMVSSLQGNLLFSLKVLD